MFIVNYYDIKITQKILTNKQKALHNEALLYNKQTNNNLFYNN
jgi:hypothetical protein